MGSEQNKQTNVGINEGRGAEQERSGIDRVRKGEKGAARRGDGDEQASESQRRPKKERQRDRGGERESEEMTSRPNGAK